MAMAQDANFHLSEKMEENMRIVLIQSPQRMLWCPMVAHGAGQIVRIHLALQCSANLIALHAKIVLQVVVTRTTTAKETRVIIGGGVMIANIGLYRLKVGGAQLLQAM